jgi:class 3 adenylate cyclase
MPGPETRFAKAGSVSIAYQVVGSGDVDVILVPQWLSNIEQYWDHPAAAYFMRRLASFSRLILFDKRGTGLSDPAPSTQTLEERMDDVAAVMDAVGSERAVLLGASEGGPMAALYAATYPERVSSLILYGTLARWLQAPDYPQGRPAELPGSDHIYFAGDADAVLDEIEEFVTGSRGVNDTDWMLTTVLFTDIVDSTQHAARLGDRRWHELIADHDQIVRRRISDYRGRAIRSTGDGVFAAFDGPARAIRCALAIIESVEPLSVELRAGLHTGECRVAGEDLDGVTVHIGARIASLASPREVLVSGTVRDLVVGSNISFRYSGIESLKGVPGEWRLFAVDEPSRGASTHT